MAIIPNLRRRSAFGEAVDRPTPRPYIDTLFDYGSFLANTAGSGIGNLSGAAAQRSVAIIGTGIGGLVAAYELLRAGAQNVSLCEATDRVGGRTFSDIFEAQDPRFVAELGAMRFPPSEFALFHYLDRFGISASSAFPDPGVVPTVIGYQGQIYHWLPQNPAPSIFATVAKGWRAFVDQGAVFNGVQLVAPATITNWLAAENTAEAQKAWQTYIDLFENESFYTGLVKLFTDPNPPGGVAWQKPDDFQLFGALGLGSGGFGPLYPLGFLELVRMIIDGLETEQLFVPAGISSLANALVASVFNGTPISARVKLNTPVTAVAKTADGSQVAVTTAAGRGVYDRVVVATSHRAAQIDLGLDTTTPLTPKRYSALTQVHSASSSKVILLTERKFWQAGLGRPENIQTDRLVRGVYFLDYAPSDPSAPGVVILSYTWEDDSIKLLPQSDPEGLVALLRKDIAAVVPYYADKIVPINNDYKNFVKVIAWEEEPFQHGAFKFNFPGDDVLSQELYYAYREAGTPNDPYIYFAGESYSFHGGWTEGAATTGVNAATAVIASLGGTLPSPNPIANPGLGYSY